MKCTVFCFGTDVQIVMAALQFHPIILLFSNLNLFLWEGKFCWVYFQEAYEIQHNKVRLNMVGCCDGIMVGIS